jgi:predicted aspartyl protease
MAPQALTLTGNGLLRVLQTPLKVCTPIVDPMKGPDRMTEEIAGIWDTGATGSVITQKVVDALELKPISFTNVNTASGQEMSPVYLADFVLPNGVVVQGLRVTLGKLAGADVLIGMDVIAIGDFTITNFEGKTKMTFRLPSMAEVDYVKELQSQNAQVVDEKGQPLSRKERRKLEREKLKEMKRRQKDVAVN